MASRFPSMSRTHTWFANVMNLGDSDSTYTALWKWASLLSYLVIFLNGTSHPVYINDPMYRWLTIGSYTLVFLAGMWLWMGPQIRSSCPKRTSAAGHVQRNVQEENYMTLATNAMHAGMEGGMRSFPNRPPPRPKISKIYIDKKAWNQLFHCEKHCPHAFGTLADPDCLTALEPCKKCIKPDFLRV